MASNAYIIFITYYDIVFHHQATNDVVSNGARLNISAESYTERNNKAIL